MTLSRGELSALLGISTATFDRLRATAGFPVAPVDWPGRPRWSRAAVAEWLGGEPMMDDEWFALITLTQVASLVGMKRSTAYRQLPASDLANHGVRLTGEVRYPMLAVATLVAMS
jgi:predicted DNA-binding transcriptional regulator AlpA